LLEPHDQLEDVLDGQRIPFTVELDDAVAFGALVCFALGGGKLDESVVKVGTLW